MRAVVLSRTLLSLTAGTVGLAALGSLVTMSAGVPPAAAPLTPPSAAVPAEPAVRQAAPGTVAGRPSWPGRAVDLDREIERLGAQPPRYPDSAREAFEQSTDLARFLGEMLAAARSGEPAAQYYVYAALEDCRPYLGLAAGSSWAIYQHVLDRDVAWSNDEIALAERDYRRCRGLEALDLGPLVEAMGDDVPGAVVEYASVWFEQAVQGGYPPALANLALRPYGLTQAERLALLHEAVVGGDPDVMWRLFGQASMQGMAADAGAVAWLIASCRAGLDCREDASWYRAWTCGIQGFGPCPRGRSAIEYYWHALAPEDRLTAWTLARRIELDIADGRVERLPWPSLPGGAEP